MDTRPAVLAKPGGARRYAGKPRSCPLAHRFRSPRRTACTSRSGPTSPVRGATSASAASRPRSPPTSTATRSRSRGAASSSTRRAPPARDVDGATHLAEKYGMTRAEALAMQDRMTADRRRRRPGLPLRHRPRRQHVRRAPHRPPRRRPRRPGRDEGAHHARLPHRGRADLRPCHARAPRDRGRPAATTRCATCSAATASPREVREDERTAARLGISAVPFFVVDRAIGASGAHPPEQLARAAAPGARGQPAGGRWPPPRAARRARPTAAAADARPARMAGAPRCVTSRTCRLRPGAAAIYDRASDRQGSPATRWSLSSNPLLEPR